MINSSVLEGLRQVKTPQGIIYVLEDGVYRDDEAREWFVQLGGQVVNWASTETKATQMYHQALQTRREHLERSYADAPLVINQVVA